MLWQRISLLTYCEIILVVIIHIDRNVPRSRGKNRAGRRERIECMKFNKGGRYGYENDTFCRLKHQH
jgi:hypothetical protein